MKKGLRKRLILTFTLCTLFTLFITLPQASGYGTSVATATTIVNGTTNEQMYTTSYAYYKVCCSAGDSLSVTLTHYGGGTDLDLKIYDIGGNQLDSSSSSTTDDECNITAPTNDYFIIRVSHYSGVVPLTINLIVTGATGSGCVMPSIIPGFEVLPTLFGLIAATFLALMILKSRRQILD